MSTQSKFPLQNARIPLCAPLIDGNAWNYVKDCLDTSWVSTAGAYVDRLENEMAARLGVDHAVATSSGTSAIHAALMAAGVQTDDEVLVSALTFIAPANAVRYIGAWPVFIDAEPRYWQMNVERAIDFLRRDCTWRGGALHNNTTGRRVRAILPVHILGHPVDLSPLLDEAARLGLPVIEDASEGLGANYRGRAVGAWGEAGCLSFNGNKMLTTGGGGMIVTNDPEFAARVRHLTTQAKQDPREYIHSEVGYNYRLTNLQAALGCAQLESLEERLTAKRAIAERYNDAFANRAGVTTLHEAPWAESVWWLYTVLIDPQRFGCDSRQLAARLAAVGVETRPLWQPLHRSPAHADCSAASCPTADKLYAEAISLPCSAGLTAAEQQRVIDALLTPANRRAA